MTQHAQEMMTSPGDRPLELEEEHSLPLLGEASQAGDAFHCVPVPLLLAQFSSDLHNGLSEGEVQARFARDGPNELGGDSGPSALKIFFESLFNAMNLILLIAFIFSAVVQDWIEASVIGIIILTNTGVSFFQEYRSEKTMEALRKMSSPTARVLRDGQLHEIPALLLVRGDIVHLYEGDVIPADLRLAECVHLEIDEALLTGENLPVKKRPDTLYDPACPLGDRKNLAFRNTLITKGRGVGITVSTGMQTEIGKIAKSVQSGENPGKTSLQRQMNYMMFFLLGCAVILALIVFSVNKFSLNHEIVLYAIAVSVAILPEGLPAVVTVTMAIAVRQMAKEKAIVRRMNALEALGEVTNICSDKTGTLTVGKMTSTDIWTPEDSFKITGEGIKPEGEFISEKTKAPIKLDSIPQSLYHLALCSSLCNTSSIQLKEEVWVSTGDPTEVALLVLGYKLNMSKPQLVDSFRFEAEMPFDSSLKRMSVVYREIKGKKRRFYLMKGAIEPVFHACLSRYDEDGNIVPLNDGFITKTQGEMEKLASQGLRVLGFAYRIEEPTAEDKHEEGEEEGEEEEGMSKGREFTLDDRPMIESGLTFLGLVGMYDPPRKESAPAVQRCYRAGIEVHMATGDHPHTAAAIAKQIGILRERAPSQLVMEARTFDAMSEEEIDRMPELPKVLARCSPESKVRLIHALHRRKKFVAMTGDGVNDAPAVKRADIGIAMGLAGSDVTKQASDIVLTDDNFSTIVKAISAGRRVFANIGKFTLHLLSGNVAEVLALVVGLAFIDNDGLSIFPMSPIQILWINLITSSPPALLLGVEKASKDIMLRPPRSKKEGLFTRELIGDTLFYGIVMGTLTLLVFLAVVFIDGTFKTSGCNYEIHYEGCDVIFAARGASFATLYLLLLLHAFNCRHPRRSIFRMNYLTNLKLVYVVLGGALLIFPLLYIPYLNTKIFRHGPLDWEWGLIFASILMFILSSEVYKAIKRHHYRQKEEKAVAARDGEEEEEDGKQEEEIQHA